MGKGKRGELGVSEKNIRKRLNILTIVVILLSICLVAGGTFISNYLSTTQKETLYSSLETDAKKFKMNLEKQINADFQNLRTLAAFLNSSHRIQVDTLMTGLAKSREFTQFIRIGFFEVNKEGIRVSYDGDKEEGIALSDISEEAQAVVRDAWNGKESISKFYTDTEYNVTVVAYAVPVYEGDDVIGALVATNDESVYAEILDNAKTTSGKGHFYLISTTGDFLIQIQQEDDEGKIDNIFLNDYIDESDQYYLKQSMLNQEVATGELTYNKKTYELCLYPIGMYDWYIFSVDSVENINPSLYMMMNVIQGIFILILGLGFILIISAYRLLRSSNRKIIEHAYYDQLTKAYNTSRFKEEVKQLLKSDEKYAMVTFNIKKFKFINEVYGVTRGDLLLCHMALVLKNVIREHEVFCRDNADVFFLFVKYDSIMKLHKRLYLIMEEIGSYSLHKQRKHQILLNCGVALRNDESTCDSLLNQALFAMKQAIGSHQHFIVDYDEHVHEQAQLQSYIESHMQQALDDGEFRLFLHPKMDLHTDTLQGAEALVRWIRKDGSMVFPNQFIPVFEQNGFCVQLDYYMVRKVCAQIREWMDAGIPPIFVSVNQSKLMFYQKDYVERLLAIVNEYQVPPSYIFLEILEGLALEQTDELNQMIVQLKEAGFKISMDDFGSGYSSLHILGNLEIDELKLDQVFLKEVHGVHGNQQETIMRHIIQLAKEMGIMTVAEGVETKENEALIKKLGCDVGQGYYYSKPISADEFNERYMKK